MKKIEASELIINNDGSVFHLHLRPEHLADRVILVGDPGRVDRVAERFDRIENRTDSREFRSATGTFRGTRMTVLSTGIGTDNIDIVMTELDALANIDFSTRTVRFEHRSLTIVRLGTSGALQDDLKIGDCILSEISIGFDGLLNFYAGRNEVCDLPAEREFIRHTGWNELWARPYFIRSSEALNGAFREFTVPGMTVSAPGFYGPQGRIVRLSLADPAINEKIRCFRWADLRIANYEMESSALAGMAALLGHRATTICTVIAQRIAGQSAPDYQPCVFRMIDLTLEKLAALKK